MSADEERVGPDQPAELPSDPGAGGTVDYELTAKDAGWRTPTLFISRAKVRILDPPRPMKRPDRGSPGL